MGLKSLLVNLFVDDVNATADFYRDVLGFEVVLTDPEEEPWGWVLMKNGGVEVMFESRRDPSGPTCEDLGNDLAFYIEVDDIEGLYDGLKDKGCVVEELHEAVYGMPEFSVCDCNGFLISFVEIR
ncbi:MAG: VOC family protein [Candidatus Hydrothermarchaeales archaeon]